MHSESPVQKLGAPLERSKGFLLTLEHFALPLRKTFQLRQSFTGIANHYPSLLRSSTQVLSDFTGVLS